MMIPFFKLGWYEYVQEKIEGHLNHEPLLNQLQNERKRAVI